MTVIHEVAGEPTTVFERTPGELEIRDVAERQAAVIRIEAPVAELKDAIQGALAELADVASAADLEWAGPPFVHYLGWADVVRANVGVPVRGTVPTAGRVEPGRVPGGHVATMVHEGPYETIGETYGRLMGMLAERGTPAPATMWEVYWSDPEAEPDPARWRTEIFVPLG